MAISFKRMSYKHKNNKFLYYFINYFRLLVPSKIVQWRLKFKLAERCKFDSEYVLQRVNYYNKLQGKVLIPLDCPSLSAFKLRKKMKTYFFDCYQYTRYFNLRLRMQFLFGDITYVPEVASITKSRPIYGENTNSVLLKLDKVRHFLFVKDKNDFIDKENRMVGRSKVNQSHRIKFLEMYFGHPLCDLGNVNNKGKFNQWMAPRLTIEEHLKYKFILCLEGYDVASNLKWVMSSNSIAVMPRPKYETWFMEGTLIPNYHYILIKDDYSDLEERLKYYMEHTNEALQIIQQAHEYIQPFKNDRQEDLISLLVLEKYFNKTGQL